MELLRFNVLTREVPLFSGFFSPVFPDRSNCCCFLRTVTFGQRCALNRMVPRRFSTLTQKAPRLNLQLPVSGLNRLEYRLNFLNRNFHRFCVCDLNLIFGQIGQPSLKPFFRIK